MALEFKRNTLVVADYQKSLKIYCDILGFTVNYINVSAADSYSYPVFNIPPEAIATFVALDSPTQERTFALTEIIGIDLPKPKDTRMSVSVIKVDDLRSTITKLKALDLETLEIRKDTTNGRSYIEQGFVDFDGHLILLYQLLDE